MARYYKSNYIRNTRKKTSFFHKLIYFLLVLMIIVVGYFSYKLYQTFYKNNVWLDNKKAVSIYISKDADFNDVKKSLYKKGIIINRNTFEWLAKRKKYDKHINSGRYVFHADMDNCDIINMLRNGEQKPVNLVFKSIRTKEKFASVISKQIEADSASIIKLLNDSTYLAKFNFNTQSIYGMFIPNTYEFYWNTSAEKFINRMYQENKKFWDKKRMEKTQILNLSLNEISTLASIVEQETSKNIEKPIIAGVYINRLKKQWRLQADPTLIFALGDYKIKRVLNEYKNVDSPYNTYKYPGLPPGPICIPSIASIDAVLKYQKHKYYYFCAKEDFSGYHNFSNSYSGQLKNARKYRRALNKLKIMK